ncbi:MAG: CarD family transcriptional regulator [Myxococcales bacterium]|nr:CarD family transcriptional regulator [Myxococcales bacterium]
MKFKVGDKAVHPSHGVAEITSVEVKEIGGNKKEFYVLETLDKGRKQKLMVATDAVVRLGLRKVISRTEAKKVYEVLRADEVAVTSQPWNRRQREYNEMLNSGSLFQVAKVLRDLYRLKGGKELSFGERRLLEQASSLLVTELALVKKVQVQRIETEIADILSA